MYIHIHRGQNQIGGSIIEVATDTTRIFLDVGINLDEKENVEVPQIDGVFVGKKKCDAVFVSHYHSDHMGLLEHLLSGIPIYIGEKAYKVFEAAANYREKAIGFVPRYMYDKMPITIGDIYLTPFLCDHSAYDSYMFLIEAYGRKVLYSGDFRANGRLDFEKLLQDLPEVDAVIIEGTTLSREQAKVNIEEEKLEDIATHFLAKHNGPVFIMMSAMNIERIITAYNIAQRTNRIFLEDLYTADVARATGRKTPIPDRENNVRVFMTGGQKQYEHLLTYGNNRIGKQEIAGSNFIMCIRQSMKNYLNKLNEIVSFEDGVLFYGMWKGYLEQPELKKFIEFMEEKGVSVHILHTSGHADEMTIDRLIKRVKPKTIIPVHTENQEWFERYEGLFEVVREKKEIEI